MFQKILAWFIQKAWPVILKFLISYADEIVKLVFAIMSKTYNEKEREKARVIFDRAHEFHEKAQTANTEEERKELQFKAEFFKQQAESYADDILKMAEFFEDVTNKTSELIKEKTSKLEVNDLFETKDDEEEFKLKPQTSYLNLTDPK